VKYASVMDLVGKTPLVKLNLKKQTKCDLYIKLEGANPTGSVKDRACVSNILNAIQGVDVKDKILLDASSGNMATSIAFFSNLLGIKSEVVCSNKLTDDKRRFINHYNCKLTTMGDFTIEGNRYCKDVSNKDDRYIFLDQLHNWNNPFAHKDSLGPELYDDLPEAKNIYGSLGSGGTMTGIAMYYSENSIDIDITPVVGCSGSKIPGVGAFVDGDYITPFIAYSEKRNLWKNRRIFSHTRMIEANDILKRNSIFAGPQTSAVLSVVLDDISNNRINGDVILVSGDSGWKNKF
jgi:[CysO sulfur-carrier protein]-thiocarboxylate-dependent cysteine synthase